MPALDPALRSALEKTVCKARVAAETAARAALQRLAVDQREFFPHLSAHERVLRRTLRARARRLGDLLDKASGGTGSLDRMPALSAECAYEHWHRMLFARFLAENALLIHPEAGVAVSLDECAELAPHEDAPDGWTLAARYAARLLPQIFRPNDPLLRVALAPEARQALERLLDALPPTVFQADDSLGWVYQFWQKQRKDEVNASGDKIDGRTIGAVTQLFTEDYMVRFLLHNTLGAWWAARHPDDDLAWLWHETPGSAGLPYLRRLEDGTPAAGAFPGWPRTAAELKVMDPCCGSGHFLVAALDLLARLRGREEDLSERDAADAVLRDNLFGLDIDARCTQIAALPWPWPPGSGADIARCHRCISPARARRSARGARSGWPWATATRSCAPAWSGSTTSFRKRPTWAA